MPRFLSVVQTDTSLPRSIYAVLTATARKRLAVTALPGLRPDATLAEGFEAQVEQAFANLAGLLGTAGLKPDDLVAVTAYVALPGMKALVQLAAVSKLGTMRPAVAIRQVVALTQSGSLIELDAEAIAEN